MKTRLALIIFLLSFSLSAQSELYKSSLAPAGRVGGSSNYKVVFTVGELAVQENTVGNDHLSEGFIGPDLAHIMGIEDYAVLNGVRLFPNPVKTDLQISFPEYGRYEIHVFDMAGHEVFSTETEGTETRIAMQSLDKAMYLVYIIDRETQRATSFKVEKL